MRDTFSPWKSRIEPALREAYESIAARLDTDGIDPSLFFSNPSYFTKDSHGQLVALAGSHPTLVHWPLEGYAGGTSLLDRLAQECRIIQALTGATTTWVDQHHCHSTVFSPVHSSDPHLIARAQTDIGDVVGKEVRQTRAYTLDFTRILVMPDGGIAAVAYASSDELLLLRRRLSRLVPGGSAPLLIHMSLGSFLRRPQARDLANLQAYLHRFGNDGTLLGQIVVEYLTYAQYTGPFTAMTLREIARHPFLAISRPKPF